MDTPPYVEVDRPPTARPPAPTPPPQPRFPLPLPIAVVALVAVSLLGAALGYVAVHVFQ